MEAQINRYLIISFILILSFVILAVILSPSVNPQVGETMLYLADKSAFLQINNSHNELLNPLMILLTQYGREVVWTMTGILLLIFGGDTGRKTALVMAITILVLIPIGVIAKDLISKPRPIIPAGSFLIAPDEKYAFPSGHALLVSAGTAVMLVLFRDTYRQRILSVGLAIEASLVCFSRVYVGGHYPLDVVSGILLGVGVAFIFVAYAKPFEQKLLQPIAKALK